MGPSSSTVAKLHRCVRMSGFRSFPSPALLAHQLARCPLNRESMMPDSVELRKRAEWYREFAERAGTPWVWEARLKTAKRLEAEADRVELEQERDNLPSPKGGAGIMETAAPARGRIAR